MPAPNLSEIRLALRNQLLTVGGLPAARAWENREENSPTVPVPPNPPAPWLRETLLPSDESLRAIGEIDAEGYVQYDIIVPVGKGTTAADTIRQAIADAFKPATNVTYDDTIVEIIRCVRMPAVQDALWVTYPTRVYYWTSVTKA